MYFTNGDHQAFERLMRGKPGNDHYDSGKEGRFHESKDRESGLFCCPKMCLTVRQVCTVKPERLLLNPHMLCDTQPFLGQFVSHFFCHLPLPFWIAGI